MKRRTFKPLRPKEQVADHHHVYVVLLDPAVAKIRAVRAANPEERFSNHKAGIKAASVVTRYGIRVLPELYEHLNPMPYAAAARMEVDLAEDLRRAGYTVTGGH